jgi:ectoine hydroxylase-related dioxygenase (phytanoyl-CoA dioxygenase family)
MVKLSPDKVEEFNKDGVLIIKGLLNADEVATMHQRAEWVASGQAPHIPSERLQVEPGVTKGEVVADTHGDSLRKMSHIAFIDEVFQAHARNPKILDVIESLLGTDIKLYQDQLFMKPPKIGSRQSYHQDAPLGFHIDPTDMVTCWAALTDSTIDNGCLWMLPGTHRFGYLPKEKWQEYEQLAVVGQLSDERPIELKAGDCSFHHGLILHSSRPNQTAQRRRGYATHYVSARCRYTGEPEHNDALLMRGQAFAGCI